MIHEDGSKFTGDTHPATEAFVKKTVIKEVVIGVYRPLKKDRVWLLVTAIPEFKTDKTVLQVIVTFYDITEKRKKEEQVQKLNNELKELTTHLQRMRKEEKNKFALEVHDKLGQKLVGVKLEIDLLKNYLKEGVPEITQKIAPISEKIEEMLKDFSEIYTDVNSTFIDDFEIYDTIDSLINSYRKYDQFKFIFSSNMQNERLPHEIKWVIYKTVKECLDNILLHSKATIASVKLFKKKGMLSLIIHDNGYEANISKPDLKKGISLIEMRERVHSIRGIIDIESLPEKGTTVKVSVPKIV
jgi:signal transduction histidine kinase